MSLTLLARINDFIDEFRFFHIHHFSLKRLHLRWGQHFPSQLTERFEVNSPVSFPRWWTAHWFSFACRYRFSPGASCEASRGASLWGPDSSPDDTMMSLPIRQGLCAQWDVFDMHLLKSCGDGDDFLDGTSQPLDVITPIENLKRPSSRHFMSKRIHTQNQKQVHNTFV